MLEEHLVNWQDRTARQLVGYEALFKLIDEIHPLDDIADIAQCVARQWKYFANVAAWRLVVQNDDRFTVIDGFRGKALVESVSLLSSWDAHFIRARLPALYALAALPESPPVPEHLVGDGISELLIMPFVKMDICYGVLTVSARHEAFTDLDKRFIRIFGSHFSSLVSHILLQHRMKDSLINKASHDALTGLLNRGAIMERLEIFFRLSKRTGEALSIIFADIDHFKSINDRFGHLAGDKVLVAVSDLLRYQTRDSDLVGRYGGEEFLFVLYSCPPAEALQASERKRVVLEHLCISMPDSNCDIGLTMSFGVSCLRKDDTSVDAVIARADAALYEAKNSERNRSVLRD